jgi:hypothetical protein
MDELMKIHDAIIEEFTHTQESLDDHYDNQRDYLLSYQKYMTFFFDYCQSHSDVP